MKIPVDNDMMEICKEIVSDSHSEEEWAGLESGDMFQKGRYCGGFDADDRFFAFSYYDAGRTQWCLSLSLSEVHDIVSGKMTVIQVDRWDDLMKELEA